MDLEFLKREVEKSKKKLGGGVLAVGYKNLTNDQTLLFNERHVFPAASIVKVPILLEYLRQVEEGDLDPSMTVSLKEEDVVTGAGILMELHRGIELTARDLARLMIVISDNTASNLMLDIVGMDNVNRFIKSVGMQDTVVGRKFMIDPKAKFSKNFTSVKDMVILYDLLYHRKILTEKSCAEAIEILSRQQYREKIPLLLPKKLKIAHKTGEITGVRHDCAIILHPEHPYIFCVLTEKLPDVILADRVIAELSRAFFDETVSS